MQRRIMPRIPEIARFYRFVWIDAESGCWIWIGAKSGGRDGSWYGLFRAGYKADGTRRNVYSHRWIYSYYNGEISVGMNVNHTCDNHLCVNPEHLYVGTQAQNVHDMHIRNRARGLQRGGVPVWQKIHDRKTFLVEKLGAARGNYQVKPEVKGTPEEVVCRNSSI